MHGLIGCLGNGKKLFGAFRVDDHDFAVLDVPNEFPADDVERASLRAQDRAAVQFTQHERPNAERIARSDQFLVGQRDEGVSALDLGQGLDETVDDPAPARTRRKQKHNLGVGRRLADRAPAYEFSPQRQPVGQIAVVGDREAASLEFGEQRLDVAQRRLACRGIAHVTDRGPSWQAVNCRGIGEMIAHQPLAALRVESRAVEGDDARRLLAAMLEGVQPERDDRGRVGVAEDAEDAALLPGPIVFKIDAQGVAGDGS